MYPVFYNSSQSKYRKYLAVTGVILIILLCERFLDIWVIEQVLDHTGKAVHYFFLGVSKLGRAEIWIAVAVAIVAAPLTTYFQNRRDKVLSRNEKKRVFLGMRTGSKVKTNINPII